MEDNKSNSLKCPACGGGIAINVNNQISVCPYCGTEFSTEILLGLSDEARIEKAKTEAYKNVEKEKLQYDAEQKKLQDEKDEITSFKKSKFSKVLIAFAIISALFCTVGFNDGHILAGIVGILQTGLFIGAYLIGIKVIHVKDYKIYTLLSIIGFVLIPCYFGVYQTMNISTETKNWSELVLSDKLPEPDKKKVEVVLNDNDSLSVSVNKITDKQFKDYVNKCKIKEFTIEDDETSRSYSAFNKEGYELSLYYYDDDKELTINLHAPKPMTTIQWPNSELSQKIPVPKSTKGNIVWEYADKFYTYIADTPKEEYNSYVNQCIEKGFNVDYDKSDVHYRAKNIEGDNLSVQYEGNNIISIQLEANKEATQPINQEPTQVPTKQPIQEPVQGNNRQNSGDVNPDFKATMDSYEAFFDEYIAFMQKYQNSNDVTSMLSDLTSYMTKYTEVMDKLNSIDAKSLSSADAIYYAEVMARISQKLASVS